MELTGCQLFKSSDHTKIFIGSHGEQNCHLAISKLDVLRKYYTPRNSIFVAHIFYNGDNENAKLCLKLFKTIGSRYLKSTILDNLHVLRNTPLSNFLNLHEAISVRAAPYIQSRSGFVPLQENYHQQSIEMIDPEQGLKDWAEFRYQAKGDHAACPTNHLPEPLPVDAALMVEPLSENSQTQQDDPLHTGDSSIKKWQQNIPKYGTRQVNEPRSSWSRCPILIDFPFKANRIKPLLQSAQGGIPMGLSPKELLYKKPAAIGPPVLHLSLLCA